jgi:16S rRNA (guanine(527)-N(7))-methyltransferase RsmG
LDSSRIAELLAPFLGDSQLLTSEGLEHISTYIDILMRWNARINLTAVRDPDEIVTRHFGESLFAARILFPNGGVVGTAALGCPAEHGSAENSERRESNHSKDTLGKEQPLGPDRGKAALQSGPRACRAGRTSDANAMADIVREGGRAALQGRVEAEISDGALAPGPSTSAASVANKITLADVGSGAGFPGIPIKLWRPDLTLTLIESNHKKATFLREVVRALTLTDINILTSRAETLSDTSFDVVTLRAVERFESILPVAARLVSPGGCLALLIGSAQLPLAQSILREIDVFAASHLVTEPVPLARARVVVMAGRSV